MNEFFHRIVDADSATARRLIVEHSLDNVIKFRNMTYAEVQADFAARGGTQTPAIWDGSTLHQGLDAVATLLKALAGAKH